MGGRNDVAHRSVGSLVVGRNTSWESMSGSAIMTVRRAGFCLWRRNSAISILLVLTPIRYSCRVSASFRLKKDSSIGKNSSGSWRSSCSQRSRRGFFVVQDKSTQPWASSALWTASASDVRGVLSDSVMLWWMDRGHHKGRAIL